LDWGVIPPGAHEAQLGAFFEQCGLSDTAGLAEIENFTVVCFTSGSGSTYLCSVLSQLGLAAEPDGFNYEFLNADLVIETAREHRFRAFSEYMSFVIQKHSLRANFLIKATVDQLNFLVKAGCFRALRKRPMFLLTQRRNVIAQSISHCLASPDKQRTAQPSGSAGEFRPAYDPEQILTLARNIITENAKFDLLFTFHGMEPIRFIYEEVSADQTALLETLQQLYGLEDAAVLQRGRLAVERQDPPTRRIWEARLRASGMEMWGILDRSAQDLDVSSEPAPPLSFSEPVGDAGGVDRAAAAAGPVREPDIRPPLPTPVVNARQRQCDIEVVSAVRALRARNAAGAAGAEAQSLREDEMKILSAKLKSASAESVLPLEPVGAAAGDGRAGEAEQAPAALQALLGLGISPRLIINEGCLPDYPHPIFNRYNQGRLEVGERFALMPPVAGTVDRGPRISLLVPVYRPPLVFLERAILSVLFQTYANWELILVDDGSQRSEVAAMLRYYAGVDRRIRVRFRAANGGISAATNEALGMASGPYVGLLDHDDMLTREALERVAERLAEDVELDLVYSDECKIDGDDLVDDLFYKPDWSPLLLLNFMYSGHLSVYRKSLVESVGGFRSRYDLSQDYDLALRVAERAPKVAHIEECLYGWRMIPGSAAGGDKPDARRSNIAALQDAADRRGYGGVAIALPTANRVKRSTSAKRPLVSIVVPSAGDHHRLQETIDSIRSLTTYDKYELIFVTASSAIAAHAAQFAATDTSFVSYDKPSNFSDKCNVGASLARGEYVVFLNDDVRVISPDWIDGLLEYLTLPGVGAVAPKLLCEDGSIQHAGIVTAVPGLLGTAFHSFPSRTTAYFNLAQCVREVSCLGGDCLAMPMRVFSQVGGWDANNVPNLHSNVDLCFRIRELGYSCVYAPHLELLHIDPHETAAGGAAQAPDKSFKKDKADIFVLKRWGRRFERDPYFPPKMRDLVYIDSQEEFSFNKSTVAASAAGDKAFALFSDNLSASDAARVLLEIAKTLIGQGHYVLVIAARDGELRGSLLQAGADVIVDPLALLCGPRIADLVRNFDAAICNTVRSWRIPRVLGPYLPVYVYCHEYDQVRQTIEEYPQSRDSLARATAVWAAGPLAVSAIRSHCGLEAVNIEAGVADPVGRQGDSDEYPGARVIAVTGAYEPRKGQDLAISGFKLLPAELQRTTRLVMAGGTNDHHFRRDIEIRADSNSSIVFRDQLDDAEAAEHLKRADIVLIPSRDDAGPLAAIDALAAGKILVISVAAGISHYIVDGESGFVVHHMGPEGIGATLKRALEGSAEWPRIAANARRLYETHFTPRQFRNRLLRALELEPTGKPKLRTVHEVASNVIRTLGQPLVNIANTVNRPPG